jgi:hypothetical protein
MSGTAALAAARKRRANPQPNGNGNYTPPTSPATSNLKSNMPPIKEEELPKATNPTMLLMQHNIFIQKLQKEVSELKAESKSLKDFKDLSKADTDYKSEYLGLLEEMKEMKKVLLKVQSFSMETNLDVMKLKRTVEQTQTQIQSAQDKELSIIVTNDIDFIAESDSDSNDITNAVV